MPGSLQFVGNATVLIRWGPFTVLTDPNFLHAGERAHLGFGLTAKRLKDPALDVTELPPLDAVVLSHLHGDHWDRRATRHLDHGLPVITTPHAARRLQGLFGFRRATGIANWESQTLLKDGRTLRVTSLPGMHAPNPLGMLLPPVMGSLLEFGDTNGEVDQRIYLTGDTLMYDGVREIARRCPDVHLAVVHLGGTRIPGGLLVTMDGQQGVELLETVMPRRAVPVHYDDYDRFTSPLSDFTSAAAARGLGDRVTVVERGATIDLHEELTN
jgi:L-ascorbate metabolism protein UlaG (beta-lactamase superfamily)